MNLSEAQDATRILIRQTGTTTMKNPPGTGAEITRKEVTSTCDVNKFSNTDTGLILTPARTR